MLARLLLIVLLALSPHADAANAAQTIVHRLDDVRVNYPEFVEDEKVLGEAECKEQQVFAGQVIALLDKLASGLRREQLDMRADALRRAIDAKAPGLELTRLATDLRWQAIDA